MIKISEKKYKKALSKFATGVTIVSINYNDSYIGKTVNSFTSLSLNPPLVLFSLDKKASSLNKYKKTKYIGINILSNKQKNLVNHFANKKNIWKPINFFLSIKKVPMIKDSVVNLNCRNIKIIPYGDHVIFICKIIELYINNSLKPLIYVNKKFID